MTLDPCLTEVITQGSRYFAIPVCVTDCSNPTKYSQANCCTCWFWKHTLMTPRSSNCKPDTKLQNDHSHEVPEERLPSLPSPKQEITCQYTAEKTPTFIRIWTIPDKLFYRKSENRENWSPSWFWSKVPHFLKSVSTSTNTTNMSKESMFSVPGI